MVIVVIITLQHKAFQKKIPLSKNRITLRYFKQLQNKQGAVFLQPLHLMLFPLYQTTILEVTKLKAFADNKLNIAKMTISHIDRVENTVGKG